MNPLKIAQGGAEPFAAAQSNLESPAVSAQELSLRVKGSFRLLLRDPFIGAGIEKIEGQRSPVEHLVVKLAEIELRT
jgi:hypothetical protein